MAKKLVVLGLKNDVFSFLLEGDEVVKIRLDSKDRRRVVGSVFLGKVKRLAKGMGGVFVDIGLDKEAYLPLKGEMLKVGDWILVQGVRDELGEKGIKLTNRIKIPGKYIVYMPETQEVKCSSKLSTEDKCRLLDLIKEYLQNEGVILRTASARASKEDILRELQQLRELYQSLKAKLKGNKKPQLLLEELPQHLELIRSHWSDLEGILCNDVSLWHQISNFLEDFEPSLLNKLYYVKDASALDSSFGLREALKIALRKRLWLKGGGYIVIEETEAMTVIDVNSGDPCGDTQEENALRTNLESVKEIAKQIILRDLGGIIMIDFIDMKEQGNKNKVINALREALGDDLCNVQIYGFTKLGVLEMARRKSGKSLTQMLTEDCPHCNGSGRVKGDNLYVLELDLDIKNRGAGFVEVYVPKDRKGEVESYINAKKMDHVVVIEDEDLDYNKYEIRHVR
jgi:ribonuclease, Rne/Rng family